MRYLIACLLLAFVLVGFMPFESRADVNIGISADKDGIKEFHFSIGTHYGVREREIEKVRARSLPDDEMAVVFYLSRRTGVSAIVLADLRLSGMSWMEITLKYGLSPEIYYVKFRSSPGPPYGNAWGHFNKTPRKKWHTIHLDDSDIVNLVNLKFLAEKHQCSPDRIVRMRKKGSSFSTMHGHFKKEKEAKKKQKVPAKNKAGDNGKKKKGKK